MMLDITKVKTLPPLRLLAFRKRAFRVRYLLGELDVVENDKWALYVEDGSVINSRSDVVVPLGSLDVDLCD